VSKVLKYLFGLAPWQKLPMLPNMYSSDFETREVGQDVETLMKLGHTRCPQGVEVLKTRYNLKTSKDLIEQLRPRRHKRRVGRRVLSFFQRCFGLSPHDPMRRLARGHQRIITKDGR
jgi:hypothetical protein